MAGVIELSSDEEESKPPAFTFVSSSTMLGPPPSKLRKLLKKTDVIVLDEDDFNEEEKCNGLGNKIDIAEHDRIIETTEEVLTSSQYDQMSEPIEAAHEHKKQSENTSGSPEATVESDASSICNKPERPVEPEYELSDVLREFVELCRTSIVSEDIRKRFQEKVPMLKKVCQRSSEYASTEVFEKRVRNLMKQVRATPKLAVLHFQNVFLDLQENQDKGFTTDRIAKLMRLLGKLKDRIAQLENEEVDFEAEENSSYMQMQRYRERAMMVFKKVKKLEREDPNRGRPYYGRLDFAYSSYPEINRALNKKYQNRDKNPFPTYRDVDVCIRKCVKENNLVIEEGRLKMEIKGCFEQLGNLIQKKRKVELANIHLEYIGNIQEDPAKDDPELHKKLEENRKMYHSEMKRVLDKYEQMQEMGESVKLSEDSDDSNATLSENEEEENVTNNGA